MDPFTIATMVATLLATKAVEKVGEKLGEGAFTQGGKLVEVLKEKSPETVKRLEKANPEEVIDAEIVAEVKRIAASDPEVQAAVNATAQAIQQQFGGVINQTKLAEKIGILIQGGNNPITIEKLEL
jgi:hypothetical protein